MECGCEFRSRTSQLNVLQFLGMEVQHDTVC